MIIGLEMDHSEPLGVRFLHVYQWLLWSWMLWCLLLTTDCKPKCVCVGEVDEGWEEVPHASFSMELKLQLLPGHQSVVSIVYTHTPARFRSAACQLVASVLHYPCTEELFTEYEMSASRPGRIFSFFCFAVLGMVSSSNSLCTWLGE